MDIDAEFFLVGSKRNAPSFRALGLSDLPTVLLSPVGKHSSKPEELYGIAERLGDALGGKRLELFTNQQREGWENWDLEIQD